MSAGKGDRPRPVDGKRYRENYDAIDWRKDFVCENCGRLHSECNGNCIFDHLPNKGFSPCH